jgi:hypothetical protein
VLPGPEQEFLERFVLLNGDGFKQSRLEPAAHQSDPTPFAVAQAQAGWNLKQSWQDQSYLTGWRDYSGGSSAEGRKQTEPFRCADALEN